MSGSQRGWQTLGVGLIFVSVSLRAWPQEGSDGGQTTADALFTLNENTDSPTAFEAESLRRTEDGRIIAEGNVRAYSGGRAMRADTVTLDLETGRIVAQGRVAIREPDGTVTFAERVDVANDLAEGVAEGFAARLPDDLKLAARRAVRLGNGRTRLEQAVYSPCPVCVTDEESEPSDPPFWRLRAREAERRPEEGSIIYRDVTFDLLGRPILYTPFLSHPDPQAERRSGFLTPNLGQSSELGAFAEIPYHFALDPSYDLTLALNPTTQAGIVGKADWRQRLYSGRYRLRGSIVNTQPEPGLADPPPDTRWNVFGAGAFDITKDWSWGFQAERTSDDTFIRRYDIERPDRRRGVRIDSLGNRLQSDVFLRRSEPTEFIQAESVFFQGLRADDRKETTPSVLPRLQYRRSFEGLTFGIAEVQFDALSLRREDGVDVQRLVGLANWSTTRIVGPGVVTRAFVQVQTDLRRADFSEGAAEVEARTLPTLGVELSWPLVRAGAGGTQVIEPVLLALASPVGASLEETPNEDSVSTELDTTNLLRTTRATGFDLIEDGQRAVVALRGKAEFRNDVAVQALIGQVFRLQDNSPYDDDSGLGDRVSDLVGRMSAQLGPHLSTTAAARFDTSTAEIRRADLGLDLRLDRISVRSSYRISRGRTLAGVPDREEFAINGRANINQNWALFGAVRRDIEADRSLSTTLGAQWSNDCTFVSLALSRDTTQDRDLEPDTTVLFRIGLRSLGEFGQGNF